jgi:hypothetical protein
MLAMPMILDVAVSVIPNASALVVRRYLPVIATC